MWLNDENSGSEGDDIEETEELEKHFKPTFVVIAIDTHPSMFVKKENGSIPFKDCLSACYSLADSLLLTSNKRSWNQFAVLLAKEDTPCLTEFRDNLIDTVKLLKAKASSPNKQLVEEYQRKGEFDLAEFLLQCKKVFHDIKSAFYKRKLIFITEDDDPVSDATKKFTVLNEIKTFSGNQIDFEVIPTTSSFDYSKFYNEVFSLLDGSLVEEICEDVEGLTEKLTSAVVMRHIRRKMIFYPFKDNLSRCVNCYKLDFVRSSTMLNSRLTKDGKPVKLTVDDSNELVSPSYRFKTKVPGQENIEIEYHEKNINLNTTSPLGLTLLYVGKRTTDIGYSLGKPFFLQVKDKEDKHFNKFWQRCVEKRRVLVCLLKLKQPGKIRYTELIPVTVNSSPMFLVKYIPFAAEIIHPKKNDYPEPESNEDKKEAVRQLVKSLTFDFDVKMIPDPCYLKKKEYVKSKLLDEPTEQPEGVTFDNKTLDKLLEGAVNEIHNHFTLVETRKRKATASTSRTKKAK